VKPENRALTAIVLLLGACAGAQPSMEGKGYSVSGHNPFRFEVERELLREWGGSGSPKFHQVLEEELERLRICRTGYVLRKESVREGVYSVSGRCKS
jgi:hypothetical protein